MPEDFSYFQQSRHPILCTNPVSGKTWGCFFQSQACHFFFPLPPTMLIALFFFPLGSIYTMVIRKSHSPFCPWKAISTQALGQNLECRISAVQLPWSLSLSCVTRYCIFFSPARLKFKRTEEFLVLEMEEYVWCWNERSLWTTGK